MLHFLVVPFLLPGGFLMGRLHDRMAEDLRLRNFSPTTQRNYLFYARRFAAFFMRSPEELGEAQVRQFLLHQIEVKHLSYPAYRQIYAALKFLYTVTLKRSWEVEHIPFPKRQHRPLPVVLNAEELLALFQAVRRPKYRTLFMTCYAAGLRIDEACHLRIADIDSKQMLLHVRHAKGGQERVSKRTELAHRVRIMDRSLSVGKWISLVCLESRLRSTRILLR